jgi:hypothetical protein
MSVIIHDNAPPPPKSPSISITPDDDVDPFFLWVQKQQGGGGRELSTSPSLSPAPSSPGPASPSSFTMTFPLEQPVQVSILDHHHHFLVESEEEEEAEGDEFSSIATQSLPPSSNSSSLSSSHYHPNHPTGGSRTDINKLGKALEQTKLGNNRRPTNPPSSMQHAPHAYPPTSHKNAKPSPFSKPALSISTPRPASFDLPRARSTSLPASSHPAPKATPPVGLSPLSTNGRRVSDTSSRQSSLSPSSPTFPDRALASSPNKRVPQIDTTCTTLTPLAPPIRKHSYPYISHM